MGLNNVFAAILGATLVAWSGMSIADEYRPGEFFGLDLSTAVLSPKPLGPATQFEPVQTVGAHRTRKPGSCGACRRASLPPGPMLPRPMLRINVRKNRGWLLHQVGAAAQQSARRAGVRYADSGLAVPVQAASATGSDETGSGKTGSDLA